MRFWDVEEREVERCPLQRRCLRRICAEEVFDVAVWKEVWAEVLLSLSWTLSECF
jgi:hypothetical protein